MAAKRVNPIDINKDEFRDIGHRLIDDIADFLDTIDKRPVTAGQSPSKLQSILGSGNLPEKGSPAGELLARATDLLLNNSLFNGHPKFMGYITASAAPIGALADLLAATVNPNVGAHILSPMATEIEKQTISWLAEFIGVSPNYGGILVSGGNMANFTAFLAARTAMAPKNVKEDGLSAASKPLRVYCSKTTHTWIDKAAILFGLGTNAVRWIKTDSLNRMDNTALEQAIEEDLDNGCQPIMVIGTAGDVSTGVVDDLQGISVLCKRYQLWFHIDGAYGVPAAVIPTYKSLFTGLDEADSIALDPHKWLYSPLEAGCTLVKDPQHLLDTYSSHPEYYNFTTTEEEIAQNYYEYGLQNSRGFRALKIWLSLQHIGRAGYEKLIGEDIDLAKRLFELADDHPELEAVSNNLSITTLRYVPSDKKTDLTYLNSLNQQLLNTLQTGGEAFLSNAIVREMYCLRACIVNFRTSESDIREIIDIIVRVGRETNITLRNENKN